MKRYRVNFAKYKTYIERLEEEIMYCERMQDAIEDAARYAGYENYRKYRHLIEKISYFKHNLKEIRNFLDEFLTQSEVDSMRIMDMIEELRVEVQILF